MWNGQSSPDEKNGCWCAARRLASSPALHFLAPAAAAPPLCSTSPLVREGAQCAPALRNLCSATSPAQTRAMHYAFTPGGCKGDPGNLTDALQDIVNFQLTRGPFAWLGHGWLGCSRDYEVPEQFNWDFGEVSSGGREGGGARAALRDSPLRPPLRTAHRALPRDGSQQRRLHPRLDEGHRAA